MEPYSEIFDDDGVMEIPTMRGSANLDAEDYQGFNGRSSILDDGLDEDVLSRPGRGAGPATDIDGTSSFDMLDGDMEELGMKQTTYGDSPWGPGSGSGYRPHSQQSTDMSLRALGDEDEAPNKRTEQPMAQDSMTYEPEVIEAIGVESPTPWDQENHGNQNSMPSNANIDPQTIYDRTSYEHSGSDQDIIGNGIFDMEEGVTWRPRDGLFADRYAMPAYLAQEDELGVQQSAMWDSTAGEWRVTQPSASGVALSRRVASLKAPYNPMSGIQTRPEVTGPRSHIEAFGRKAAACLIEETRHQHVNNRSQFLERATAALGPRATMKARAAADQLIKLGYRADIALEDALAHCIMHATVKDLTEGKGSSLPRLDRMTAHVTQTKGALQSAAATHLAPLSRGGDALNGDLGAFHASPAFQALSAVDAASPDTSATAPAPPSTGMLTTKNVLIAGGLGFGAWMLWGNRKKIVKNLKKLTK